MRHPRSHPSFSAAQGNIQRHEPDDRRKEPQVTAHIGTCRIGASWELIVEAGRDPVTGRKTAGESRVFHGTLRDAKKARAELLVEVGKGRHTGTAATSRSSIAE